MAHYKGAASEGTRAANIVKKREKKKEEFDLIKQRIQDDQSSGGKLEAIGSKFSLSYDVVEEKLKTSTVGLVTLDQMKERQEALMKERELELAAANAATNKAAEKKEAARKKQLDTNKATLSFQFHEEEEAEQDSDGEEEDSECIGGDWRQQQQVEEKSNSSEEGPTFKKRKIKKNPDVDTSFLPDRAREEEEARTREGLRQKWIEEQEALKDEDISITFSYWDGSGHRKTVQMKKGSTVREFLQKGLDMLRKDFSELRVVAGDQLMYIKEDLIIPQHYTFYDFIVTKARGKSGPLFSFDVHEDIRLTNDAKMEKEESHAGKVVLRSWYERNKHIFPASRWEAYDPERKWDKYTISDGPKPK